MKLDLGAEHTVYRNKDGQRVPGVTTILSEIAKPHLMNWYANEERAGVLAAVKAGEALPERPFAEAKRDRAADIGTVTHAMCESWLKQDALERDGITDDLWQAAQPGYDRFRSWWDTEGFSLLHSELVMVSDTWDCGGTADIIAKDRDGRLTLIDLKTSKASTYWPYRETFAQVAAYATFYETQPCNPEAARIERLVLNRIGKAKGDHGQVRELTDHERQCGFDMFVAASIIRNSTRKLRVA